MENNNSKTNVLLFVILLGVAWLIWPPLTGLIILSVFLKSWHESRVIIYTFKGSYTKKDFKKNPENLIKCEVCKVYFQTKDFKQHVEESVKLEQEEINKMSFLSHLLAKNRHLEMYRGTFIEK